MGTRSIIVAVVISLGLVATEVRSARDEPGDRAKPSDRGRAKTTARPPAGKAAPDTREESRLRRIADRKRETVMLLGRFHQGLFETRGTAFVISKSRRLLATCGHVADWFHNDGPMLAVAGGDGPHYKVIRVWYHPGLRRYLDWDLPTVRSTDPEDGPVDLRSPDLAVIEVTADGPELPGEWTLAGPEELPRENHPAIGKLGFGMDRPHWFANPQETPLGFGVGVIEGSFIPKPAVDGEPADAPILTITVPLRQGDSGGPIFLPNGHVVAICNQITPLFRGGDAQAGIRFAFGGVRIDSVHKILDDNGLLKSLRRGVGGGAALPSRSRWKPDPRLDTYRKAVRAVRAAEKWASRRDWTKAIAACDKAIRLIPRYGSAYMRRGIIRAQSLDANRGQLAHAERLGQLSNAIDDISQGIRLVNEDGYNENFPFSSTFQAALLMSIQLLNDKGDLEGDPACFAAAVFPADSYLKWGELMSARGRAGALGGRAWARLLLGKPQEALRDFDQAIELEPNFSDFFAGRALAKTRIGKIGEAVTDANKAIRLNPRSAVAFRSRGGALVSRGDFDGAIRDLDEAIRLDSEYAEAFNERGVAWMSEGHFGRAIADFGEALRLGPRLLWASNNLAWLLATCPVPKFRDGKRAVEVATRMCEQTDWKDVGLLDTLATAQAEAGNFDRAVEFEEKALALVPDQGDAAVGMKARLDLFRDGKPFREDISANHRQNSAPEGKPKEVQP